MAVVCLRGQDQSGSENRVYTEYVKVPLDSGSLLIMEGAIQHDWQVSFTALESQSRVVNSWKGEHSGSYETFQLADEFV